MTGNRLSTIWEMESHTKAKHDILKRYLGAWFPIMDRWEQRIIYIDGFAGPGEYSAGEKGSPIIALETALKHRQPIKNEVVFIFIEADSKRCEHLDHLIKRFELPKNFHVQMYCERFDERLTGILDYLEEQEKNLAPTFAFIDPFGYSHTPFDIVTRIMAHDKCEILITFMYEEINRFVDHPSPSEEEHRNRLFGTEKWQKARGISDPKDRRLFLHDLYKEQLEKKANIRYVRSFEMINKGNRTDYFLFFGTNNITGLRKMKEAMWNVDETSGTVFSDTTDFGQMVLFDAEPDYGHLRRQIIKRFKGGIIPVEEIERFVLEETAFRETHYKKQILAQLEKEDKLEIIKSSRKKSYTYPEGTILRIL